jgi:hypothetical protein
MALQEGVLLRNAKMNAINTSLGASATLKIFSGAVPVNCAAADPSGLLLTINLPATPFGAAAAGAIALSGTWTTSTTTPGTAASFRIFDSSGNCAFQGNVTTDLVLNNTSIGTNQTTTVTTFSLTAGNA